jgi:hypothetical protein
MVTHTRIIAPDADRWNVGNEVAQNRKLHK